ncbi:MAG: phytanoyl-CoA dioxygenase family protein [Chthoniobacterales bacterium]
MSTSTDTPVLSADQLAQLDKDGYCITDILFDEATLKAIQSEFQRMWEEEIEAAEKSGDAARIDFAHTKPFMSYLHLQSEACKAFTQLPPFVNACRQILGPDVDMTWDQSIIKPPSEGKAFGWHQDAYYAVKGDYAKNAIPEDLVNPKKSITFWCAITRTIVDNGTLWVVPGMHKQGLLPHVYNESTREWQGQHDTSWKVPAVLKAGQVLVFTNCTPHGSGANISKEIRMAYQIGYSVPGLVKSNSPLPLLRDNKACKELELTAV